MIRQTTRITHLSECDTTCTAFQKRTSSTSLLIGPLNDRRTHQSHMLSTRRSVAMSSFYKASFNLCFHEVANKYVVPVVAIYIYIFFFLKIKIYKKCIFFAERCKDVILGKATYFENVLSVQLPCFV